jgi:hypothetical protein
VSKRSAKIRFALAVASALLAASLPVAGAQAQDSPPAQTVRGQKPQASPAAADPAAAGKPAKAPEKSMDEQRAEDGPWAKGTNWLSFRAGYAKASGDFSGDGLVGYGIAFQRMMTSRWSFGGSVQHDLLGHLGAAYELEVARHFKWQTGMRPYVGLGAGYYFHKFYRTGGDMGSPGEGLYVNFGTNLPVDSRHLLGLDTRVSFVQTTKDAVNPVFGTQNSSEVLWSAKLNWAFTYY